MKFFPKRKKMNRVIREHINCLLREEIHCLQKEENSFLIGLNVFLRNDFIPFGETSDKMSN